MSDLFALVNNEQWNEAAEALLARMDEGNLSEEECILGATIMEHFGDRECMYQLICFGLKKNPQNYELYLMLGNYYSLSNVNQAYLSYENALFYAQKQGNEEDQEIIRSVIVDFKHNNSVSVRRVSFIILSYNTLDYTQMCIQSIRSSCLEGCYEIVVVDNASEDGSVEWLRQQEDIVLVENSENAGFPAGCNQGIDKADPSNDIFLLNNDTLMLDNSLYMLRMGLYEKECFGAAGAVTNYAANKQILYDEGKSIEDYYRFAHGNNIPRNNPYELKSMLIMFAMLIKREVYEKIGKLDERYGLGNYEDNDYGMRMLDAGYQNVLCWNCFIYHYGSKSFDKNTNLYSRIMGENRQKFREKWGFDPRYYINSRIDLINLINATEEDNISVLEVGCGLGDTLSKIKYSFPNSEVHGIELVERVAELGAKKLDIKCGNIESMELGENDVYDYIIFGDVLEHLTDPARIIRKMRNHLKDGGCIITSIPNIMNATIIYELLHGNFTYQDAGILDRTHLRFFTQKEIQRMFDGEGYDIDHISGILNPGETTADYKEFFDKILELVGEDKRVQFDVYQYLIRAKKINE